MTFWLIYSIVYTIQRVFGSSEQQHLAAQKDEIITDLLDSIEPITDDLSPEKVEDLKGRRQGFRMIVGWNNWDIEDLAKLRDEWLQD